MTDLWALIGSPPRAWGRGSVQPHRRHPNRFTPTCVGKSSFGAVGPVFLAVHPHVRGEETLSNCSIGGGIGSPPRAWGRARGRADRRRGGRFTPTCVGKRTSPSTAASAVSGSPPRAWGRVGEAVDRGVSLRFTPTCVGKSWSIAAALGPLPVHPHVRGEETGPIGVARHEIERVSPSRAAISRSTIKGIPS